MHSSSACVWVACLFHLLVGFSVAIHYTISPASIEPPNSQPYINDPVVLKPVYHSPNSYEQESHKFWYENKPHPHRHGDQPDYEKRHQHFAKYNDNEQFRDFITDPPGVGLNSKENLTRNLTGKDSLEDDEKSDAAVIRNPPTILDKDLSPGPNDQMFIALSNVSNGSSSYGDYGHATKGGSVGVPQAKIIDPEENNQQKEDNYGDIGKKQNAENKKNDQNKGKNSGYNQQRPKPKDDNQLKESKNVFGTYSESKHPSKFESFASRPCCPCCGNVNDQGNEYSNLPSNGCNSPYCGPPKIFGTPPNCCAQAPRPCCLQLPKCCLPQFPCCPRIQIPCCPAQPVCCQPLSPCGVCRSTVHKALRTKRMGCLPCVKRKRRDVHEEETLVRTKRMSCIPCLHKKRAKRQISCQKCSIFGAHLVNRIKRSFVGNSCNTCRTKFDRVKRQTEIADFYRSQIGQKNCMQCPGISQPYFSSLLQSYKSKRKVMKRDAGDTGYDPIFQCKKSCCDYDRCIKSKPLQSSNQNSKLAFPSYTSTLGNSEAETLDVDLNDFDSNKWNKQKKHYQEKEEFLETSGRNSERN